MPFKPTHGMSRIKGKVRPTFVTWSAMIRRCTNPKAIDYKNYGSRGIVVCERWLDVRNFIEDMGDRPSGMSLERVDNNGPYSKENCIWADRRTQNINTRRNVLITHNGETHTVSVWAERLGLSSLKIYKRIHRGWNHADALDPRKFLGNKARCYLTGEPKVSGSDGKVMK